ncbi:MAG: hypothetical protein ACRCT6_05945 [Notoacmeibacter sp.]
MIDALNSAPSLSLAAKPSSAERHAAKEFEAVLLTGFIENMLPKNMGGTETNGPGADVWRSFMASAVADQLAGQNLTGLTGLVSQSLIRNREGA